MDEISAGSKQAGNNDFNSCVNVSGFLFVKRTRMKFKREEMFRKTSDIFSLGEKSKIVNFIFLLLRREMEQTKC